jgi:hypothetical protein
MKDIREWKAGDCVLAVILSLVVFVLVGNLIPIIQMLQKSSGH